MHFQYRKHRHTKTVIFPIKKIETASIRVKIGHNKLIFLSRWKMEQAGTNITIINSFLIPVFEGSGYT